MVNNPSDGFKIGYPGSESDNTESAIREEFLERRVDKLGNRITLIAILIPILIGVIFTVAYLDIKKRVYSMQDAGGDRFQKLSEDLESKFSSLSVRFAGLEADLRKREKSLKELEDSFTQKIVPMEEIFLSVENTMQSLKADNQALSGKLEKMEKGISEAVEKNAGEIQAIRQNALSQEDISGQFAAIEESFEVVQSDMRTLASNLDQVDENFKSELKALTDYLETEKKRLNQSIEATKRLSDLVAEYRAQFKSFSLDTEEFVRDSELPLQIEKARLKLKVALDEAVRKMENRLNTLEKKMEEKTSSKPAAPSAKPGEIIERNLQ